MGQELVNVRRNEVPGMPTLMEVHVAPDPLQVGLLGAEGQVPNFRIRSRATSSNPGGFARLPISTAS